MTAPPQLRHGERGEALRSGRSGKPDGALKPAGCHPHGMDRGLGDGAGLAGAGAGDGGAHQPRSTRHRGDSRDDRSETATGPAFRPPADRIVGMHLEPSGPRRYPTHAPLQDCQSSPDHRDDAIPQKVSGAGPYSRLLDPKRHPGARLHVSVNPTISKASPEAPGFLRSVRFWDWVRLVKNGKAASQPRTGV